MTTKLDDMFAPIRLSGEAAQHFAELVRSGPTADGLAALRQMTESGRRLLTGEPVTLASGVSIRYLDPETRE